MKRSAQADPANEGPPSQRENNQLASSDNQCAFEASHTLIPPPTAGYEADELMFPSIIVLLTFCSLA